VHASSPQVRLKLFFLKTILALGVVGAADFILIAIEVKVMMQESPLDGLMANLTTDEDVLTLFFMMVQHPALRDVLATKGASFRQVLTVQNVLFQKRF
jgi:hypothetical protein